MNLEDNIFFTVVIIVTDETAHLLPFTLDSVTEQSFPAFEIVIVDGQTKEHNLTIFEAYKDRISRIYTALDRNLSAMMNKGISLAKGEYLHFLMPGEFYLSRHVYRFVEDEIRQHKDPHLIYSVQVLRHHLFPPRIEWKKWMPGDLKRGMLPASLQSFWFQKKALVSLGRFDTGFKSQGGLDMICRIFLNASMHISWMRRVLTDYEYRRPRPKKIVAQFWETLVIICRHFGLSKALLWWTAQNHLHLLRWWMKGLKRAFLNSRI